MSAGDSTAVDDSDSRQFDSPVGRHVLLRAMVVKRLLLTVRYRVNLLFQLLGLYVFFAIVFFGGQAAVSRAVNGPTSLSSTFEGFIVGWFLWTMAQTAYQNVHSDITSESQWGTLEQLYISPYGFGWVMGLKSAVNVLLSVFLGGVLLVLMMVTTWTWFTVDVVTLVPIIVLTIMSVLGLGFVVGGLALVYKKVGSINNLMQFVLMGLIAAPVADKPLLNFLPLAQGSAMLQEAMRDGVALWEFSTVDISILVGTGVGYFTIGFLVFSYASKVARRRGVMGHY